MRMVRGGKSGGRERRKRIHCNASQHHKFWYRAIIGLADYRCPYSAFFISIVDIGVSFVRLPIKYNSF